MVAWVLGFSTEVYTQQSLARAFMQGAWHADLLKWPRSICSVSHFINGEIPKSTASLAVNTLFSVGLIKKISAPWMVGAFICDAFVQNYLSERQNTRRQARQSNKSMLTPTVMEHHTRIACKVMQAVSFCLTCQAIYGQPRHLIATILPVLLYPLLRKIAAIYPSVPLLKSSSSMYPSILNTATLLLVLDNKP